MGELIGELIMLRDLTDDHGAFIYNWVQDKEVVRYSLNKWQKYHTKEEFDQWFTKMLADPQNLNFAIITNKSNKLIGYAGFCYLNKEPHKAEYFIFIGDKNEWGKGFGTEVTKLVVKYGFEKLGLQEITLTVSEPNVGGLKAYEKAGFIATGRLENFTLRDGVYHDKIVMSIKNNLI